jgi:hypothetical protein
MKRDPLLTRAPVALRFPARGLTDAGGLLVRDFCEERDKNGREAQ